jgi:demethylmenaquinone methyltransferase/2-methoxy-6-polyprenyl-1,4-benzoquinol methylase
MAETLTDRSTEGQSASRSEFDRVAGFYEWLANVYSTGQIASAKASQVRYMKPGQNVLYVGVGAGEDALLAARAGVDLVCLDSSPGMLDRLRRRLPELKGHVELICEDVFDHRRWGAYDVVVANFFLNCFEAEMVPRVMDHLAGLIRPGGQLMIADVAPPQGSLVYRWLQLAHHAVGNSFFWALGLVALHPIWDYRRYFSALHLELQHVEKFRLLGIGPIGYESLVVRRACDP